MFRHCPNKSPFGLDPGQVETLPAKVENATANPMAKGKSVVDKMKPKFSSGEKIGITTTVPVEVIYAAGCVPVDLNNIFIASANPQQLVEGAELAGYPRNVCAWIKGIYSVVLQNKI